MRSLFGDAWRSLVVGGGPISLQALHNLETKNGIIQFPFITGSGFCIIKM